MLGLRASFVRSFAHKFPSNTTHRPQLRWNRNPTPIRRNLSQSLRRQADVAAESRPANNSTSSEVTFAQKIGTPPIRNQVLFWIFGSATVFTYAAWVTNLRTDELKARLTASSERWKTMTLTSLDLKKYEQVELVKSSRRVYTDIVTGTWLSAYARGILATCYATVRQPWVDASDGKRMAWKIILLNIGVYAAWKIRSLEPSMWKNFTHTPLSGKSFTLLTAVFSHMGLMHLFFNCFALEGFGSTTSIHLMREQERTSDMLESTSAYHTLAFYASAGVFSSLISHIVQAKLRYPAIIRALSSSPVPPARPLNWNAVVAAEQSAASIASKSSNPVRTILGLKSPEVAARKVRETIVPSLGASGAVYACVTMTALAFPESKVALVIPPSFPIDIQYGVGALICMDMFGIWRGWRMFDHYAHLGGAAFGAAYYYYGMPMWNALRKGMDTTS